MHPVRTLRCGARLALGREGRLLQLDVELGVPAFPLPVQVVLVFVLLSLMFSMANSLRKMNQHVSQESKGRGRANLWTSFGLADMEPWQSTAPLGGKLGVRLTLRRKQWGAGMLLRSERCETNEDPRSRPIRAFLCGLANHGCASDIPFPDWSPFRGCLALQVVTHLASSRTECVYPVSPGASSWFLGPKQPSSGSANLGSSQSLPFWASSWHADFRSSTMTGARQT